MISAKFTSVLLGLSLVCSPVQALAQYSILTGRPAGSEKPKKQPQASVPASASAPAAGVSTQVVCKTGPSSILGGRPRKEACETVVVGQTECQTQSATILSGRASSDTCIPVQRQVQGASQKATILSGRRQAPASQTAQGQPATGSGQQASSPARASIFTGRPQSQSAGASQANSNFNSNLSPIVDPDPAHSPENVLYFDLSNGGRVTARLMPEWAPHHVERIKTLVAQGFYNGVIFHRVIDGFMAQTGDPTGTGQGGSQLPDLKAEFNAMPHVRGTLSMARTDAPDSANSQFFIVFYPRFALDRKYTVFGRVIGGMDSVDKIERGEPPEHPTKIVQASMATDNRPPPPPPAPQPAPAAISVEQLNNSKPAN